MKVAVVLPVFLVLSSCATVSYSPPEGTANGVPVNLVVLHSPRVLTLGSSRLQLVRSIDEHDELPYLEDGGSYKIRMGADYMFHSFDGKRTLVTIEKEVEVTVNPGGRWLATLSSLSVRISGDRGSGAASPVLTTLGGDSFLDLNSEINIVVTRDFQGTSQGRAATLWNQPAAFVFKRGGELLGYLSMGEEPVFYGAKGRESEPEPEVALAVLVAWECAKGEFDPPPVTLPERGD